MRRILRIAVATSVAVIVWADVIHWRSSRRRLGSVAALPSMTEAVVVLGFRNRGRRANPVNRYRIRAALRSFDPRTAKRVLVTCGRGVGPIPEAHLLAALARRRGFGDPIRIEADSMTTRENIRNAIPLIEDADAIAIVSNSLHAEMARAYLWELRPDLADRLVGAREHRFGEVPAMKVYGAIRGLWALRRLPHPRPERVMSRFRSSGEPESTETGTSPAETGTSPAETGT